MSNPSTPTHSHLFVLFLMVLTCLLVSSCTTVVVQENAGIEHNPFADKRKPTPAQKFCITTSPELPKIPPTPVREIAKIAQSDHSQRTAVLVRHIEELNRYIAEVARAHQAQIESAQKRCVLLKD